MFALSVVIHVFAWQTFAAQSQYQCYWPDGTPDPKGFVCNTTQAAGGGSPCCLANDACYASGSCFQDWSGITYRQSCTDKTWASGNCPTMCKEEAASGSMWIQQCSLQEKSACCVTGQDSCCNDNSNNTFTWKPGYLQAVINGDGTNRLGPYVSADGVTQGVSAKTASTSSSSGSTPTSNNAVTATTQSPTGSQISQPVTEKSSADTARTVGLAVGLSVGLLMLMALVACLFFWRRTQKERAELNAIHEKIAQLPVQSQQQFAPYFLLHHPEPGTYQPTPAQELDAARAAAYEADSGAVAEKPADGQSK